MTNNMNAIQINTRISPYWHELEKLSKDDKINLIALLSASIVEGEEPGGTQDEGMERLIKNCFGTWKGEETTEEIIANINESKCSKSAPVKF